MEGGLSDSLSEETRDQKSRADEDEENENLEENCEGLKGLGENPGTNLSNGQTGLSCLAPKCSVTVLLCCDNIPDELLNVELLDQPGPSLIATGTLTSFNRYEKTNLRRNPMDYCVLECYNVTRGNRHVHWCQPVENRQHVIYFQ